MNLSISLTNYIACLFPKYLIKYITTGIDITTKLINTVEYRVGFPKILYVLGFINIPSILTASTKLISLRTLAIESMGIKPDTNVGT